MLPDSEIRGRLDDVRTRIAGALGRARRPADSCRLVLATKTQPAEALLAAYRAGACDFGENYVQEAAAKRVIFTKLCQSLTCHPELASSATLATRALAQSEQAIPRAASGIRAEGSARSDLPEVTALTSSQCRQRSDIENNFSPITWHLIGHLQTNKAAMALANFSLIHSLDSARLAATLHRLQPNPPVRTLLEINLGDELSKTGVAPDEAEALLAAVRHKVEVLGLMTIPPHSVDPTASRPYFVRLRELRDRLAANSGLALAELSMGMTDDYTIAIEEGATIVRVGRAVFGERT